MGYGVACLQTLIEAVMTDVNIKPEYGSQYSAIRALLSNSYIQHYYAKEVSEVPALDDSLERSWQDPHP
jgi:hypothetical protein